MASGSPPSSLPHDDIGAKINAVNWALAGLSAIFLALRVYCKWLKHRGLWWDDHILILAWVATLIDVALVTAETRLGLGRHIWDVENPGAFGLLGLVAATFAICAAVWSKTSFAVTLLRLTSGWTTVLVWFAIWSINILMGISALLLWIPCNPLAKSWNAQLPGTCWDPRVSVYSGVAAGVYSGVTDIVLALVPWTIVWKLQMRRSERIGIAVAMSMGVFAGSTAFVKSAKIPLISTGDFTYEIPDLIMWGVAESATTIMAASIPVLRVLVNEAQNSSARRRGQYRGDQSGPTHMFSSAHKSRIRSLHHTVTGTKSGERLASNSSGNFAEADGSSDKSILRAQSPVGGAIVRKDEVRIVFSDRKSHELNNAGQRLRSGDKWDVGHQLYRL